MNHLLHNSNGLTPYQKLTILNPSPVNAKEYHIFRCPACVLNSRLTAGIVNTPKWESRVRMGICVGQYPAHASHVGLVLNPHTWHVSPQFHVAYNGNFTTVPYLRSDTVPPHWAKLIAESSKMNCASNQRSTWQTMDIESAPEEGDFLNIDTGAIVLMSQPVTNTQPYQEPIRNHQAGDGYLGLWPCFYFHSLNSL